MNLGIRSAVGRGLRKIARKVFDPLDNLDIDLNDAIGWHSISGGSGVYGYYRDNQFENGYSSITKLANGFAQTEQYTVDKNGKAVSSVILDRMYTPNTDMSAYDFREALAVTFLTQDKVRLRVHHTGSQVTAENIKGFTFLEGYSESITNGQRNYLMPNGDRFTDAEIITLKSVNPNSVTDGFSASRAAKRWTKLDDYIADYQQGFFENGAVPAGEMIITAPTVTEFNDIVDMMQQKHRGAKKSSNIVYTHRPTDAQGKPMNAQIEWIPYASPNKDLSLKELFENANKKIDSVYGVPQEIRGFLANSNYASVAVAERVFVKYALNPMTLKIWQKFTHELNRITGGTSVAITYDLEIPSIADEEKVNSEAKAVDANTVSTLVAEGFLLDTAINYVKTGDLAVLKLGEKPTEDKPEVLSSDEAKDTPSQPIDIYAKSLAEIHGRSLEKALDVIKDVAQKPTQASTKRLSLKDRNQYEYRLAKVVRDRMKAQISQVIDNVKLSSKAISEDDPIDEGENVKLSTAMIAVLGSFIAQQGAIDREEQLGLFASAGINTDDVSAFAMTSAQKAQYHRYLTKIAKGYNEQTADKIRGIISAGREQNLSAADIKTNLTKLLDEEWRIKRLAVTEVNRAGNEASLFSMQNIAEETNVTVEKVWVHGGGDDPCEFCEEMIDTAVPLDQEFLGLGDSIRGADGGVFENNFIGLDTAELHPNCHCRQEYVVVT